MLKNATIPRCGKNKKKVISGQNISYFTGNSSPTSNTCHMYSSSVYTVYSYAVMKVSLSLSCQMHFFVHNIHTTSFPDLLSICVSICAFFTFFIVPYPLKLLAAFLTHHARAVREHKRPKFCLDDVSTASRESSQTRA